MPLARRHWRARLAAQLVVANSVALGALIIVSALLQILWPLALAPAAAVASLAAAPGSCAPARPAA